MASGSWKSRGAVLAVVLAGLLAPQAARAQFFWEQPRLSADDAARVAIQHGFRLLARPARNDDVYVADVIDRRGLRERLVIAGDTGQILRRTIMDDGRFGRPFARDPSLPPGPVPPGRIPEEDRQPGFFARLFGGDDDRRAERPPVPDRPVIQRDDGLRPPRVRRTPRVAEPSPELIRPAPVESAPLAPPGAAPPVTRTPRPSAPKPAEASLPPAAAPAPAPSIPAPPAAPTKAISSDPLAIPGSREQDEKAGQARSAASTGRPAVKPPVAAPGQPAKPAVPVAPLE